MLNNISWASYIYAVCIIIVVYYIFIGLFFYRHEAVNYIKNPKEKNHQDDNKLPSDGLLKGEIIPVAVELNSIEEVLLSLLFSIKKAASQHFIKEELLQSLKGQIQFYVGRASSLPKEKINQYITETSETYCSIHLSEMDLVVLWEN